MRDRILLVGEDFGNSDPEYHHDAYALTGASGRRLVELCGYQGPNAMLMYALDFERTNVVTLARQWRDKQAVRDGVLRIAAEMVGRRTILLGSRVAAAFRADDLPILEWSAMWASDWAIPEVVAVARVPHPSGRSHWWNDPANVRAARAFMRAARAST